MRIQDFDEPRHVRALEVVRQFDVHVERCDRMLNATVLVCDSHRVPDRLDTDLVYSQVPRIFRTLDIRNSYFFGRIHVVGPAS